MPYLYEQSSQCGHRIQESWTGFCHYKHTHTHAATQKVKLLSCKLCCSVVDSRLPLLHKRNVLICELQTFIGLNFNNILSGRHDETNSRTTTSWQDGWDTNMLIYRSFRKMTGKLMLHTEKISGNCCNMYCPSPQNPKWQLVSFIVVSTFCLWFRDKLFFLKDRKPSYQKHEKKKISPYSSLGISMKFLT